MCKKLTNLQNTKIQKITYLSIFYKSNKEFNNIFLGIDHTCNNISLICGVTTVWIFMYGKNSEILY